ncbi:hypothetical protein JCM10212_004127 [Sporobolomyces blumeae]
MKFSLAIVAALSAATLGFAAPMPPADRNNATTHLTKRSYSGQATFYTQGGNPGACGDYHSDSDYIVALQSSMYSGGSHCGSYIKVTNTNTGASTKVKVADECPSCEGSESIDLSTAAFEAIGSKDKGVLPVSWNWA